MHRIHWTLDCKDVGDYRWIHLKTDVPEDDPCYYEKLCRAIIDAIQVLRTQVVLLINLTDFLLRD